MQTFATFTTFVPVALLLLQGYFVLFLSVTVLKKAGLLKTPYAGMEYSHVVLAAAIILGAFIISLSDASNIFQAYKTYSNQQTDIAKNTFIKFGSFLLIIVAMEVVYAAVVYTILALAAGTHRITSSIQEGDLPLSILLGVVIVCFALVLGTASKELVDLITPRFLVFR